MSTLILQTALLLLGAYFLGAWLACVIRRSTVGYHADDALASSQSAHAASGLATAADQVARAPMRRAEVVPVAPQMETISRPIASPVAAPVIAVAPVVAAPVITAKAPPVVAAPAAPVDSVTRFQDVLTGTQRPAALAPAPVVQVPAGTTAAIAATAATATVAATVAAAAKVLTPTPPAAPSSMVPAAPPRAPVPAPIAAPIAAPATDVRTPVVPAPTPVPAPFTIPTPGPTRTGVSLPIAAGSSGQTSAAAPLAAAVTSAPATVVVPPAPAAASVSSAGTQAVASADDLTRVRAIDSALHAKLHQLGVRRYADIAAWTPSDVARISQSLGFQGRIEQENWIEQAQILSRGGETAFARRKDRGEASVVVPSGDAGTPKATIAAPTAGSVTGLVAGTAPTISAPVSVVPPASAVAKPVVGAIPPAPTAVVVAPPTIAAAPVVAALAPVAPVAPRVADRAAFATPSTAVPTLGPLVTAPLVAASPAAPVAPNTTLSAPATGSAAPASATALGRDNLQRIGGINAEVERVLNVQGVGKYNQIASWTEKDTTRFDRLLGYEGRIARENWIEQAQILSRNGETAYSRQFDAQHGNKPTAVVAAPTPVAQVAALPTAAPPSVAAAITAPLAVATGVTAAATAAVAKVASSVGSLVPEPPRPARLPDAVVDQIRAAPVAPAPMPPVAAAPVAAAPVAAPITAAVPAAASTASSALPGSATRTSELAGLRSVRSEAYSPSAATTTAKAGPDDLKRIRGVGVLIERKLNSMGINSYAQVANWTSAEIDRVSQVLDFKGKVERENWVEQARILSAGGQTEFSRRVDRGDDMNKPK